MNQDPKDYGTRNDRIYEERIGVVETEGKDDPRKLLLVRVRVLGLFDNAQLEDLPWAEVKLPIGCDANAGAAIIAAIKKGQHVWLDFPYCGDTRRPRITGSVHHAPGGVLNLPHEAFAGPDTYQHKRTGNEPPQAAHVYGEDVVLTFHGFMVAINKDGSANVVQKGTGTEITFTKEGDAIMHVEGNFYQSATKSRETNIDGNDKELVMGRQETTALGGIDHDGGTGDVKGTVNGHCACAYTGKPHPMISSNVKSTL